MLMAILVTASLGVARANCPNLTVPPLSQQAATIVVQEAFPTSYVRITLANLPPGFTVTNGVYLGWCVEYLAQLNAGTTYNVTLYDSYGPLPSRLQSTNWDLVNYIINHKQGDADDVQTAIWNFIGGPVSTNNARYFPPSAAALAIISDALANGEGFVPTQFGQVSAVIVDPGAGVQILIAEVAVGFNRPPVAGPDTVTTPRNVALSVPLSTLLANDSDPDGDALTVVSAGILSAQGGTALLVVGSVLYTPPLNFTGSDTFTYVISDNKCGSATGLVMVAVTSGPGPTNRPPVAVNDTVTTERNTMLTINSTNLLANDTDADGDLLTIIGVSTNGTQGGTVQLVGGNVIYTPPPGFVGNDTFTYIVSDGRGGTNIATVTVVVQSPNHPPTAVSTIINTFVNVPATLTLSNLLALTADQDGDPRTIIAVNTVSNMGLVVLTASNVIAFPPTNFVGTFSYTYTVSDGRGGTAMANVDVNVLNVPFSFSVTPPVFNPQTGLFEQSITIVNDSFLTVPAMQISITGLRTNIRVWNATGSNAGTPYLLFNRALNPAESGTIKVEYYVPDRRPFTPGISVMAAMPAAPITTTNAPGAMIDRCFVDRREGERFVIEWASLSNRTYVVFYSDDMTLWKAATPSVRAVSNRTQWYDDGPPKTDFKPPTKNARLYRVVLMP